MIENYLNSKKYIIQLIPEGLYNILGKNSKVDIKGKSIKLCTCATICSMLLRKYELNRGKKMDNLIMLHSSILQEKYGCYYTYYLSYLEQLGYIKRFGRYTPGESSYRYRLTPKFLQSPMKIYYNFDKVTIKKYKSNVVAGMRDTLVLSSLNDKEYIAKKSQKKLPTLIDKEVREKLINDLYKFDLDITIVKKLINYTDDTTDFKIGLNYMRSLNIAEKHIWYNLDKYGRMHTNYTVLKRDIRKLLTYKSEKLCELDISNSQPLLLALFIKKSNKIGDIVNNNEYIKFSNLVKDGNIYLYFMEKYMYKNIKDVKKNLIYKVFFGDNKSSDKSERIFKKEFPSIYSFIKMYKYSKNNYKSLSHILQLVESDLIFNKIVKDIVTIDKNIPLITIHDSIIFPESYKEIIEPIFNSYINNLDI